MKKIKWLLDLANRKPLIFSLALLMIGISTLAIVVADRDKKITECERSRKLIEQEYTRRVDSLGLYYRQREAQLSEEVKAALNSIILEYKLQLEEQKNLNNKIRTTISDNNKLINRKLKK